MGELSPWHWAIVILIAVLLFGSRRLPDAARSLGRSARILKAELRGVNDPAPAPDEPPYAELRDRPAAPAPSTGQRDGSPVPQPHDADRRNGSTAGPAPVDRQHADLRDGSTAPSEPSRSDDRS